MVYFHFRKYLTLTVRVSCKESDQIKNEVWLPYLTWCYSVQQWQSSLVLMQPYRQWVILQPFIHKMLPASHYHYFYGWCSDKLHSLALSARTFTASNQHTIFTVANHTSFLSCSFDKDQVPLEQLLPQKNYCFVEHSPKRMLPYQLQSWSHKVQSQLISILHVLIICIS